MENIIQLKITLLGSKPPIWRRILVEKNQTFEELHDIIQVVMGWHDCHLHEFYVNGARISAADNMFESDFMDDVLDASKIELGAMLTDVHQKFQYTYDFGDDWAHQIVVEQFLAKDNATKYPTCIAGKMNCPPEDCGGIYGFYDLLEALADPKHPDHEDMVEWLEEDYDAKYFNKDEINNSLILMAGR